jgi:antitoxin (DNA-binding transcriptional repressor) of toxin-antitoxin stability system
MKMVGIAELKARLSEFLDIVKSGEDVLVTERGRPVATLSRTTDASAELDDLVRAGIARAPREPLPEDFFDRPRLKAKGGSALEALLDDRREGR